MKSSDIEGYRYSLPGFRTGSRLLFIGDSITDMNRGRKESDRNHYLGHSYVYLIGARLGLDMPEAQLDLYNRGISGNTIGDLRARWEEDALAMRPDLLSILIGTNDVGKGRSPEAFASDYRYVLDASRKASPDVKLVLLDPFVLQTGSLMEEEVWTPRRAATDHLCRIVASLAKEYQAVHIRTQDAFDGAAGAVSPEHWMWDGVHPLPQGHELIARIWLREVSGRWPKCE